MPHVYVPYMSYALHALYVSCIGRAGAACGTVVTTGRGDVAPQRGGAARAGFVARCQV